MVRESLFPRSLPPSTSSRMTLPCYSLLLAASLTFARYEANAQTQPAPKLSSAELLKMAPAMTPANLAPRGEADPTGPTAPHATEQELLQSGIYIIQYSIQLSRLALTNDLSADMRAFATRVLDDYTRNVTYLNLAANQTGVQLPTTLTAAHQNALLLLSKLSGKVFEEKYVGQVKHSSQLLLNTVVASREAIPTQAPALRTWVGTTIALTSNHLGMVQEVERGKTKL
jgi:predicted outer membrane protein